MRVAEAGKVWDRGGNWTSVVVEVVGGAGGGKDGGVGTGGEGGSGGGEDAEEDADVLEIPVFVRMEYEAEVGEGEGKGGREKRELAFWVVLGWGGWVCKVDRYVQY